MLRRAAARHRQSQAQSDDWRSANPLASDKLSHLGQELRACYDSLIEEPLPERLAGFVQVLDRRAKASRSD
jgi:hypothetical protein